LNTVTWKIVSWSISLCVIIFFSGVLSWLFNDTVSVESSDDDNMIDYGAVVGMRIGRGSRSTLRQPALVPLVHKFHMISGIELGLPL
jgi:hypothetical protein